MFELSLLKIKGYLGIFFFLALTRNTVDYNKKEIEELVEAAKKGDKESFESLYKIFADTIYRYLFYMVGNKETAHDLTSQVFLKAYEKLKSYRFKGYSFSAWLYKIAHNLAIDHFRSLKRRAPEIEMDMITDIKTTPEEPSIEEIVIDRMTVESALKELTTKQRQVIILKYIEQMRNDRIAEILGKTTSAVKALEQRALAQLRNIILRQLAKEQKAEKEEAYASR